MKAFVALVILAGCTTSEPDECDAPAGYYVMSAEPAPVLEPECGGGTQAVTHPARVTWFEEPEIDDWRCTGPVDVSSDSCSVDVDVHCCPSFSGDPLCMIFRGTLDRTENSRRPHRSEDAFEGVILAAGASRDGTYSCSVMQQTRIEALP